jgi:2-desacetyl-2-hydroxyethyl bacteriochlorophyllide A dehydrogenase
VPGAGEALVRVLACGLCGSDLFLQDGGFGEVFPVVPGHEAAGRVVAVGPGVTRVSPGDLVALYYIDNDPGAAWANLGPRVRRMGVDVDGALADHVIRPERTLVPSPGGIAPVELALLTDAVATPYHALTSVAGVRAGETVVVVGVGGIGSNAVQLARLLGAEVYAVGRSRRSLDLALRLGATRAVTPPEAERVLPRGADIVLVCADAPGLDELAVRLAGYRARIVLVAASRRPIGVSGVDLIWRECALLGSRGFTPQDIVAVHDLYLRGDLVLDHLVGDIRPLTDVAAAFDDLRRGGTTRIVIAP